MATSTIKMNAPTIITDVGGTPRKILLISATSASSGNDGYHEGTIDYSSAGFSSAPWIFAQPTAQSIAQAVTVYGATATTARFRTTSASIAVRFLIVGAP